MEEGLYWISEMWRSSPFSPCKMYHGTEWLPCYFLKSMVLPWYFFHPCPSTCWHLLCWFVLSLIRDTWLSYGLLSFLTLKSYYFKKLLLQLITQLLKLSVCGSRLSVQELCMQLWNITSLIESTMQRAHFIKHLFMSTNRTPRHSLNVCFKPAIRQWWRSVANEAAAHREHLRGETGFISVDHVKDGVNRQMMVMWSTCFCSVIYVVDN